MPTKKIQHFMQKDQIDNYYYRSNPQMFNKLADIINNNKYPTKILTKDSNEDILNWIHEVVTVLLNPIFTIQTKVNWILLNQTSFNSCLYCNNLINNRNSAVFSAPLLYCCVECQRKSKIRLQNAYKTNEERNGAWNYNNRDKAAQTSILKYGTKNNMQSELGFEEYKAAINLKYGVCYTWQCHEIRAKAKQTTYEHFGVDVSSKAEIVKAKQAETNLKRYGYISALQNPEVHAKTLETMNQKYNCNYPSESEEIIKRRKSKYTYNSINFDSKPEIAFYIWLTDNNINFDYNDTGRRFIYYDMYGKKHFYYPDFYLIDENKYIEIKGDNQLVNGTLINISNPTLNYIAQAKYQCMLDNNVEIYTSKYYKKYILYINKKYGKNYLKQFKNSTGSLDE